MSLYIKRADLYQTKEFIKDIFTLNNIGIVKDVKFIEKADLSGRVYNGAIVIFDTWFMNKSVEKLLDDMSASPDGTVKFIYDYRGHFWYINVYKPVLPESEKTTIVDPSLPDKQRIEELEKILQTMMVQMHNVQLRQECLGRQLMETEEKMSRQALLNIELRSQLEDRDIELECLKREHAIALKQTQKMYVVNTSKMSINDLV